MIAGALFYYRWHWSRNRLLTRIRRLRQPKYLFGAIVGGFYFYWYFFRNLGRGGRGMRIAPEHLHLVESVAALALLVMFLLAWILPHARTALVFTEAEVAFLFPAPISRRALLHYKLLKSQFTILFSAIFMALIGRSWGGGNVVIHVLGWWVVFATFNLHLLGSSFAVTKLMDRGLCNWLRRILVLGVVGAAVAGIVLWFYYTAPPLPSLADGSTYSTFMSWLRPYAGQVLQAGPVPYVLFPFRLVVAPYFTVTMGQFLIALGPALAVMGLHYWWVMRSNVAFEEASVELSRKTAERVAAMRSGNWQSARKPKKPRRPPFQLRPAGWPAIALFWKNLISAGSLVTARMWMFLVWMAVFGGIIMQDSSKKVGGVGEVLAFMALFLAGASLFWGPQFMRNDLRQDLPTTDVLKMFPMPGWQVVLGEVLAPEAMLAGIQWLLLLVAVFLSPNHIGEFSLTVGVRIGLAVAAAILLPCVDLIAMIIPNAAVLFFPAWFRLGKDAPRGFETMGQRLILMFGQLLILALSLVPAAAAFAALFMLGAILHTPVAGILLGSVVSAAVLLLEAGYGLKLLGGVFERFDLSGELLQSG